MFSSLSTCPLAHSPADALLPYASLLVLFFLLSIPAGVPTPYCLPSTSQFLAMSLTQDQHFFGRLSQDVFELSLYHLFSFSIFFLIFIKTVSPAIQSCSLSSLSLSFISRGRKERFLLASAQHGMVRAEPVCRPPLLPGFSLSLVSGTCCGTPPTPVSPTVLFKGEQNSAWLMVPAQKRLRLAWSWLVPSATPPCSQNREVTPLCWACSALPRI